jgi:hypothetical protein
MRTARRSIALKWGIIVMGAWVAWVPVASKAINTVGPTILAGSQDASAAPGAPAPRFSAGVADILKMVNAKVDAEVIKTYINNSSTAYNPSATEIIALKDRGVAPEIITAMLQHGAEARTQLMRAAQAAPSAPQPSPGAVAPYAPVPGYDYGAQSVYPNYTYTYPTYSYVYPSYVYDYPVYSYGCSWPWCWPYFSFGYGCYPYGWYCGYPHGGCGYRYPCYWGGHGYYGGGYYGHGYYGGNDHYGHGSHPPPCAGAGGSFHSFGSVGRPTTFASSAGGMPTSGGFGTRPVAFAGGGGGRGGGGFGGHSMGRSR